AFVELQQAGKVRHIGVCNVTVEQLAVAQSLCTVVSVQNRYNAGDRRSEAVLAACEGAGIPFLPWGPLLVGDEMTARLGVVAEARDATPGQVALAWLLRHSPVMAPIPGTSKVDHADENVDAALVALTDDDVVLLSAAG